MTRYYLDTAIWRDYWENRSDGIRPLGEWAYKLIEYALHENHEILYSDMIVSELQKEFDEATVKKIFEIAESEGGLVHIPFTSHQLAEARLLCRTRHVGFGDSLHAVLARDNDAVLVTRDADFLELVDICDVGKPEDLL